MILQMPSNFHQFLRILFERDHGLKSLAGAADLPAKHQPCRRQFWYQIMRTQGTIPPALRRKV